MTVITVVVTTGVSPGGHGSCGISTDVTPWGTGMLVVLGSAIGVLMGSLYRDMPPQEGVLVNFHRDGMVVSRWTYSVRFMRVCRTREQQLCMIHTTNTTTHMPYTHHNKGSIDHVHEAVKRSCVPHGIR